MTKYESSIKVVKASTQAIYNKLSDFSQLGNVMPQTVVQDWEATADECHFTVDKVGRVGFKIAEKTATSLVKYTLESSTPMDISLFVQIKPSPDFPENESRIKLTISADIPTLMRPLIGGKLQEVVNKMAESMSMGNY